MKKIYLAVLAMVFVMSTLDAAAHMMWIKPDRFHAKIGERVTLEVGWGHHFPAVEKARHNFVHEIYALSPSGKRISLKKADKTHFSFTPAEKGSYLIAVRNKAGFMTKTTTGRKMGDKKGVENAVYCFRFDIRGKSAIQVGDKSVGINKSSGQELEIIPLSSIGSMRQGRSMDIEVKFKGKPVPGIDVKATYAEFKAKGGKKGSHYHPFAFTTKTGKDGRARIKILKKGYWLIFIKYKFPYSDKGICDDFMYVSTFTFKAR